MRKSVIKMFRPKRRNNGAIWASLASIGIGAAVYGMTRGKQNNQALPLTDTMRNLASPLKETVKNIVPKMNIGKMNTAQLAEFSEDLMNGALHNQKSK
ncbi:hypothetical protein [Bacillus rubiinfantis]|uniref:hypothetical protein n=1 Tax=Bacillus rubiinfantis TaxID=1499680 RepID=UPI000AE4E61E|nr:hypothetical protein [Bacillus rubiinfantis]